MKLYSFTLLSIDQEEMHKSKTSYIVHYPYGNSGVLSHNSGSIVFSTKKKAKEEALRRDKEYELESSLLVIKTQELDNTDFPIETSVVNLLNNKIYKFSYNFELLHQDPIYKKGDWVLFYSNLRFQIGRVGHKAKGLEPYFIIVENCELNDEQSHEHVSEAWIIKSLDEKEVKNILPCKFISLINLRYETNFK